MPPEQLDGRADHRSDILAFGAVLSRCSRREAFDGATSSAVDQRGRPRGSAAVSSLARKSRPLDRVARRCLAKDPDARWQSTADLVDELRWIARHPTAGADTIESPVPHVRPLSALAAIVSVASIAAALAWLQWRPASMPQTPPETRTEIVTSATDDPTSFALSPTAGRSSSWRPATARPASGCGPGGDNRAAAGGHGRGRVSVLVARQPRHRFLRRGRAEAARSGGGAPQTLAPAPAARGGTWGADSVIVFAPTNLAP